MSSEQDDDFILVMILVRCYQGAGCVTTKVSKRLGG